MVMATSILGFRSNETGSEVTSVPGAIVISDLPLNVSALMVDASIVLLPFETAICTTFIVTGSLLNSLENFKRRFFPPTDTHTTWRNVLLVRPGAGGMFWGSTN